MKPPYPLMLYLKLELESIRRDVQTVMDTSDQGSFGSAKCSLKALGLKP